MEVWEAQQRMMAARISSTSQLNASMMRLTEEGEEGEEGGGDMG